MIVFNKVTWYSKLAAVILFLLVVPALTFYIGTQYQLTKDITSNVVVELPFVKVEHQTYADKVKNPVTYYAKELFKLKPTDSVWVFDFDITQDGKKDIFLSDSSLATSSGNIIWMLFVNNGDGTFSLDTSNDPLVINPMSVGFGTDNGQFKDKLMTYIPEKQDAGTLFWYSYEFDELKRFSKKMYPAGKDQVVFTSYIKNGFDHESNRLISIDEINVSNIQ